MTLVRTRLSPACHFFWPCGYRSSHQPPASARTADASCGASQAQVCAEKTSVLGTQSDGLTDPRVCTHCTPSKRSTRYPQRTNHAIKCGTYSEINDDGKSRVRAAPKGRPQAVLSASAASVLPAMISLAISRGVCGEDCKEPPDPRRESHVWCTPQQMIVYSPTSMEAFVSGVMAKIAAKPSNALRGRDGVLPSKFWCTPQQEIVYSPTKVVYPLATIGVLPNKK
jgi:hypothetical protein